MTTKKKGRCWKGCKPVPGKKPFSKGSCSCGMAALTPGMIELARGDFAIPALKKALRKGIGNAGEPVAISEIGVSGTMIPSLRKNPKNVQRATKKYWGQDEGMAQATGAMRYNRDWAAKTIREDRGKERYRRMIRENLPDETVFPGSGKKRFESLTPGMIEFAADNRPRNGNGQYVGNETMGVDPNSMQAAYGNVEQEKMMRRRSLVQRMRSMMGRAANEQVTP